MFRFRNKTRTCVRPFRDGECNSSCKNSLWAFLLTSNISIHCMLRFLPQMSLSRHSPPCGQKRGGFWPWSEIPRPLGHTLHQVNVYVVVQYQVIVYVVVQQVFVSINFPLIKEKIVVSMTLFKIRGPCTYTAICYYILNFNTHKISWINLTMTSTKIAKFSYRENASTCN